MWRVEGDAEKRPLIQGMIKIAAALDHFTKGEHTGVSKLLSGGLELLQRGQKHWEACFPEWDLARFAAEVAAFGEMAAEKRRLAVLPKITLKKGRP
ncbi:MAG: DUF309 domain-containing protein [Nitrospiraceae bacterium]|nr:DUF309 domain-containing protein [Nitrospiraceae bacterium]